MAGVAEEPDRVTRVAREMVQHSDSSDPNVAKDSRED